MLFFIRDREIEREIERGSERDIERDSGVARNRLGGCKSFLCLNKDTNLTKYKIS